ncbi:unnamed protein product [Lasius platythorax]|uniref:OPA3-like protein n=1 Tax=Lasius platythorax TaxID=488582 RepID=A0AAV2NJ42_9HYME
MPVGVFPALKLGVLFVKQISKPLAKFLVNQAKSHPIFRTYFIIPPAQFYHWAEVKAKMYVMNLGKPTKVAKLNETMAIELGASLMGELIIFSVAGGCVILEYNRQVAKEAKKEEEARIHYLQSAISELARHTRHKLPEPVSQQISNSDKHSLEDNTKTSSNKNSNSKSTTETSTESENKSLIERAIIYYKEELKADKIS